MHARRRHAIAYKWAMLIRPPENGALQILHVCETGRTQARGKFGGAITTTQYVTTGTSLAAPGKPISAGVPGSTRRAPWRGLPSIPPPSEHREAPAADDVDLPASPRVRAL